MAKTSTKKKAKKNIVRGVAHIKASFNNTHVALTDPMGAVISWGTAGCVGEPNSAGLRARIEATGSPQRTDESLVVYASDLPAQVTVPASPP